MVKKKAIMRDVLTCFILFAILVSAMPVSIFAMNGSNNATEASNHSNDLEKSFISPLVSNDTGETVSALSCDVYVKIEDDTCVGYDVYVDGVYQFTEGQSGTPDGYCAFYVSAGTHKFELRKNGCTTSKSWYCQCGTVYRWVSMPDNWCDGGNHGEVRENEIKFTGTAIKYYESHSQFHYWVVRVDKIISGPQPCKDQLDVCIWDYEIPDPWGSVDQNLKEGDQVEVYGTYYEYDGICSASLYGLTDYYIKKIEDIVCEVYVIIDDDTCVGYEVYVDGVYQFTEGQSGTPDGYCAFYVSVGTHKFELRKNGYFTSKSWYCQCGTVYRWVSMPDNWCGGPCTVYIIIDDDTCVGYEVYVDGVYQFTEGQDGTPDGYCSFHVTPGTHKFELRKNGCSVSKSWYCQCGTDYSWVSMNDMDPHWCDPHQPKKEVKFRGNVTGTAELIGARHWYVSVDEWISGSLPCDEVDVVLGLYPPMGSCDENINKGDSVEVYGVVDPWGGSECTVGLNGESYYIKKASTNSPPTLTEGNVNGETLFSCDTTTQLIFSVTYSDPDNDDPEYVKLKIGDSFYDMVKADPDDNDYTDGCIYTYSTIMSRGKYFFTFSTRDGNHIVSIEPDLSCPFRDRVYLEAYWVVYSDVVLKRGNFSYDDLLDVKNYYECNYSCADCAHIQEILGRVLQYVPEANKTLGEDEVFLEYPCLTTVSGTQKELKFSGEVIEPDNKLLDDQFDCKVKIDKILETSGDININVGDEVLVTKWWACGFNEPGAKLEPEIWNIKNGDNVEVYGNLSEGYFTSTGHSDSSFLVDLCGSDSYYFNISTSTTSCGEILEYTITNGTYTLPQTVMAHMKYKNYMKSPTKFKGVFLVKNQRTGKIYPCSKEQITNIDDRFGYGKGNSLQIRFEDEVEDIGVYDAKIELRNFYTDELCDETEWLEGQFKIDNGSALGTCINFDELSQGDITGQTLHYDQVDFVAEDALVSDFAHSLPNGIQLGRVTVYFKTPVSWVSLWLGNWAGGTKITLYASDGELLEDVSPAIGDFTYYEFSYAKKISKVVVFSAEGALDDFCFEVEGGPELRVHNLDTGKDFAKIQAAIDDTDTEDGHTITVDPGTYNENIIVNKSIKLKGIDSPAIDVRGYGTAITIAADACRIEGFKIISSGEAWGDRGVKVESNSNVIQNNTFDKYGEGIRIESSSLNTLIYNTALNGRAGIILDSSDSNTINSNILSKNDYGIYLWDSSNDNKLSDNNVSNNERGIWLYGSSNNLAYHNNLINNVNQAYDNVGTNSWDNGYPSGGNYWSDYKEKYKEEYSKKSEDVKCGPNQDQACDGDGIWDAPYTWIDGGAGAKDNYPLMEPWGEKKGLPDLTLLPEDITFSNPNPSLEETITITATIHNIGEADVDKQFFVSFFEGPPENNVLIDAVPLFNVDAKVGTAIAAVSYKIESVVAPEIFVVVDSNEDIYIDESNELNNIESRILDIIPGKILPVPYFNQRYTEWCMYNSLAMVLQYYGVEVHSWDIAKYFSDNCFQLNPACQLITFWFIGDHDTAHPLMPFEDCGIENYVTNIEGRVFKCYWIYGPPLPILDDGWFDIHIKNPIDAGRPVIYGISKHVIVFVGYSIENNIKYVYIHDPAGDKSIFKNELNYEKDGVFEKVPWETFKNYINSHLMDGIKTNMFYSNEIYNEEPATPLPVIYLCDGDVFHTERGGKKESGLYLDHGLKYNTTNLDLKPDFDFGPNKRYLNLRWIDNNHLNYTIRASNPTSEPITLSVDIELKGNNDVTKNINIPIGKQSDAYIDGFIEFTESGHEKLFITAKLNGNPVDQIGPIYINIIKPEGLSGEATCPVDLSIKDPDGLILSKQLKEIPGATYTERDINGDGDPDDMFLIPDRKIGDYQIIVTPEPDAEPSDTYTLTVSAGGTTTVLAKNVSVSEIPAEPYIFNSDINQLPRASFSFSPEYPVVNQVITLNASPSAGFITNYKWDFGDGSPGTGEVVTHAYANTGTYSVTLTVEDNEGNTDTNTQIVEVKVISPTRDIPISTAANSQLRPTIAYNSANNEYLVTWDDKRSGSERDIYAQRLSGANSLVGSNFAIALSSGTDIGEVNPFVAYNPTANEYLVVWNEKSGYHNLYYIYAQRVSNTGSLLGDKITVSSGGVRVRKLHPSVAYNPANNEYLIVWYGQDVEGQSYRIYGQRLSSSGSLLASNFAIGEDIGKDNYQYYPQVAYNSHSNDYLVVWEDMRNGGEKDIYAQKVSGSCSLLGSNYCICNAANEQEAPSVAYNSADNQYLVTWQDGRTGSNTDIHAQMISGAGNLQGNEIAVRVGSGTSLNPSVTYNSKSNVYFVAWEENDEIFAHEITSGGGLSGSSVVICDAVANQGEPSVAYNSVNNLYFVTWQDYRNGNYDIYGAWTTPQRANQPPINPSLTPDKPDPQNAGTSITWTASATDSDGDTLSYRFWIKSPSTGDSWAMKRDWNTDNTWTWHTSSTDTGDTDISVWIRDGHHEPPDKYDLDKVYSGYNIQSARNQPPVNPSLVSNKAEPQTTGTSITWTASAIDPEGDTLYYRFWTKGPSTGDSWTIIRDWSTDNTWTWHTSTADIGDTDIAVRIRDGHHAPASGYDLEKICYDYAITGSAPGLVAEWHFDEGSGSTVKDNTGNGNDGIIYGATRVNGIKGKGLKFDGNDDYVEVQDSSSLRITGNIKVEAWVKVEELGSKYHFIVSKHYKSTGYTLFINPANKFAFEINGQLVASTTTPELGKWYHVVGTYDQSQLKIYVNDVFENTKSCTAKLATNNQKLRIGQWSAGGYCFKGIIDEVGVST